MNAAAAGVTSGVGLEDRMKWDKQLTRCRIDSPLALSQHCSMMLSNDIHERSECEAIRETQRVRDTSRRALIDASERPRYCPIFSK